MTFLSLSMLHCRPGLPFLLALICRRWSTGLLLAVTMLGANAQPAGGMGVQLVQRIDDVLYGVDPISLAILNNRYVSGVLVRVNASQPTPVLGYSHFVADCQGPQRMAIVSSAQSTVELTPQGSSARARYEAAKAAVYAPVEGVRFSKASMLDGSRLVAGFACSSTQRPARTAQIAKELFENGGPADMRTALCDLQPDGGVETREDVEVRYSDSEKVVAVNNQWLSSGRVSNAEISFGSGGARWRIDRNTSEASLVTAGGKVIFAGSCAAKEGKADGKP